MRSSVGRPSQPDGPLDAGAPAASPSQVAGQGASAPGPQHVEVHPLEPSDETGGEAPRPPAPPTAPEHDLGGERLPDEPGDEGGDVAASEADEFPLELVE